MPNPLIRLGTPVQSRNDVKRPRPVVPIMEDYAGDNNPYRGTENHGVSPTVKPHDPDTYGVDGEHPDGIPVVLEMEPEKVPDPVPVRIVNEYKLEINDFGTDRIALDFTTANNPANRAVEVLGKAPNRTSIRIRNLDATNWVLIGASREEVAMRGYPLLPGQEVSISAEVPVFAAVTKPDGTFPNASVVIAYMAQYVVKGG